MNIEKSLGDVERVICDSRNEQLRRVWKDFYQFQKEALTTIRVTVTMRFFATHLHINLIEHYQKPAQYVANSLKIIKFLHEHIHDDRILSGVVINFGEVFEPSLFGCQPVFWPDQDPGIIPNSIITTEEDLENLTYPDFYTSGLMPQVLEVHNTAEKLLKGRIPVFFERWDRGPWGIAIQLRGFTELIKDTLRRPEFVHKLLTFITEARMRWEQEKERYLGTKTWQGSLADDEVTADLLSPRIYRTFAYPCERRLAEFYPRGIFYFHSCGDLTPFLDTIKTIPGVQRILISPHTDFNTAVNTFKNTVVYQKRMHPIDDVLRCPPKLMEHKLKHVLEIGEGQHLELDPGPIVEGSTNTIAEWINITRRLTRTRVCEAGLGLEAS